MIHQLDTPPINTNGIGNKLGQTPKTLESPSVPSTGVFDKTSNTLDEKPFLITNSQLVMFLEQAAEIGAKKAIDEFKQARAEILFTKYRYSRLEVAKMLNVSTTTLDRNYRVWNLKKEKQGQRVFFSKSSVDKYISLRS